MKFDNFASLVRQMTGTNITSFPTNENTLLANEEKNALAENITRMIKDFFELTLNTDLVDAQREYAFPQDVINNIKLVEAQIDGETWRRLREFDLNSYKQGQSHVEKPYTNFNFSASFSGSTTDEETIQDLFSDTTPQFDIEGRSIVIYSESPIINVPDGLKLRSAIYPEDYTDADFSLTTDMSIRASNTSTALPRAAHLPLAMKVALRFKQGKKLPLTEFETGVDLEIQNMKRSLKQDNSDKIKQPHVPRDTGFTY